MPQARRHYLLFAVVLFIVGLLGALTYRMDLEPELAEAGGPRQNRLGTIVEGLEAKRDTLETELGLLRDQVAELEAQHAARKGLHDSYSMELSRLRMLAGLEAVEGSGLVVTLADNPRPPQDATDPNNYLIHDYDLRSIINALWGGGAEAMTVNDERLVQFSAVRCVGTTVLVNSRRLGSPFVIAAIGDPASLRRALDADHDAAMLLSDYSRVFGLRTTVNEADDLRLPPYRGSLAPRELSAVSGRLGDG